MPLSNKILHTLFEVLFNFHMSSWLLKEFGVWQSETSRSTIADLDPVALPRLLLVTAILRVLKEGLGLLGIRTVEEM